MHRTPATAVVAAVLSALLSASQGPALDTADFVEIDAVVVDNKDQPVHGLKQGDFSVREDGRPVAISTFTEVTPPVRDDANPSPFPFNSRVAGCLAPPQLPLP